jgi:hypothetical protein
MKHFYKFLVLSSLFTIFFAGPATEKAAFTQPTFVYARETVNILKQQENSGITRNVDLESTDSFLHVQDGNSDLRSGPLAVFGFGLLGLMLVLRRRGDRSNHGQNILKTADISGTEENGRRECRSTLRQSAFKPVARLSQPRG